MSRHPSEARLASWMAGGPDDGVGQHVESCERCADVGARIAEGYELPTAFADALRADEGLEQRVLVGATTAIANRAAAETFLGLLGLGFETAKIVFDQEDQS